jgi:hypothetical protein
MPQLAANVEALFEGGVFGNMPVHFCTSNDLCFTVENST